FSRYNLTILKVKGRSDLFLRVEVIKKIIGVATLFACLPFGIEVIVWGLCITNVLFAYINGYFSGKMINYSVFEQLKHTFGIVILSVVPFTFVYYLNTYFENIIVSNFIIIFISVFAYLISYLPFLFFFNKTLIRDILLIIKR